MTKKILVVDDEKRIVEIVKAYLEKDGYRVIAAYDGSSALDSARRYSPDLIVLDLMLPEVSGWDVCRELRRKSDVPIIMLTARRDEVDRIAGLEMGADDYVVKPFSPQELVSRVRAVLRRTRGRPFGAEAAPLEFEDLLIDPGTRIVTVRGEEMQLTAKEFDLLLFLASNARHVFNRDQILDRVWGLAAYIDSGTVTVHIRRLREKIEIDPSNPRHILTVWGVGYKFEP